MSLNVRSGNAQEGVGIWVVSEEEERQEKCRRLPFASPGWVALAQFL